VDVSAFIRRLRTRPPSGEKVELKPLEQAALALVIRTGGASTRVLQVEVDARSPVLRYQAAGVVDALMRHRLVEARLQPDGETVFVPTARGLRLRKRLPDDPKSVTDFWL
jgi:hypothetical protein